MPRPQLGDAESRFWKIEDSCNQAGFTLNKHQTLLPQVVEFKYFVLLGALDPPVFLGHF